MIDLAPINNFLKIPTPKAWIDWAVQNPELMLIDHAHCEKKAASSAMTMLYRYVAYPDLLQQLSRLAREELRHFEQVLAIMQKRGIDYQHLSPSGYADGMREHVRTSEPNRLIDILIIGAYIEARSCERFAVLIPYLDDELANFYNKLLASESRHFEMYLKFAGDIAGIDISQRIAFFAEVEAGLIESVDEKFRFHSGVPA